MINKGFTLIETLAAILLLSIALAGPMTIAQKGLSASLISKDQNTAFNLAQDAVEYVRFSRDTNCLAAAAAAPSSVPCPAVNWLNGIGGNANTINLSSCISTDITQPGSAACYLDSYANTVTPCTSGVCSNPINYDSTNNDYTYGSGTATIFTRTVQIQYNSGCTTSCNASEADVVVTVSWSDPVTHSISVRESLYNWQ
jgi:prepilin-type N-terminal cleavage/methylation domain-containing protein